MHAFPHLALESRWRRGLQHRRPGVRLLPGVRHRITSPGTSSLTTAEASKFPGPPPRGPITEEALEGARLFQAVGCTACHSPALVTGESPVKALSSKRFFPYSDFLLHDVGTGDGIGQGDARPEEIRTPPLWGVRLRAPFLHDGRASTLRQALELHSGESARSRGEFDKLSAAEQSALLAFLLTL